MSARPGTSVNSRSRKHTLRDSRPCFGCGNRRSSMVPYPWVFAAIEVSCDKVSSSRSCSSRRQADSNQRFKDRVLSFGRSGYAAMAPQHAATGAVILFSVPLGVFRRCPELGLTVRFAVLASMDDEGAQAKSRIWLLCRPQYFEPSRSASFASAWLADLRNSSLSKPRATTSWRSLRTCSGAVSSDMASSA